MSSCRSPPNVHAAVESPASNAPAARTFRAPSGHVIAPCGAVGVSRTHKKTRPSLRERAGWSLKPFRLAHSSIHMDTRAHLPYGDPRIVRMYVIFIDVVDFE